MWNLQAHIQYQLPAFLSIRAKIKFKQSFSIRPEDSKFMLTTYKHCCNMKAQTDNDEHINDNRFSILFLWVKNSNNKDNNALKPISILGN